MQVDAVDAVDSVDATEPRVVLDISDKIVLSYEEVSYIGTDIVPTKN